MPRAPWILPLSLALGLAAGAHAHGINGHVHVTGWAIETQPAGSVLAAFFADPELKDIALIAAAFPDSGYAVDHPFGEAAHWEPFIEAHIAHVRARYGPDFADPEARRQVAFLIGSACHGLQDELFDSVFLFQIAEKDGAGQDEADPGTDAFLHTDGYLRFRPALWLPAADLVEVFASQGIAVDARTLRGALSRVRAAVINGFAALAPTFDARYRPLLPWTAAHYVDPTVPGSLAAEIPATAAYQRALWARLHGEPPVAALVVHGWPHQRRLRSAAAGTVDGWITLVFAAGITVGSLNADTVQLLDPAGAPVPITVRGTRWGGSPTDSSRLVTLRPAVDLALDTEYTVRLNPGVELIDGTRFEQPWETRVQTPCADPEGPGCAPPAPEPFPPPPPPDAGLEPGSDLGLDLGLDLGPEPVADLGRPDAARDLGGPLDAGRPDAGPAAAAAGGGGCQARPGTPERGLGLLALLGLGLRIRRRSSCAAPARRG